MTQYNQSGFLYNQAGAIYDQSAIERTATGSGTGTETAVIFLVRVRTATGSGTGTETATRLVINIRTGSASAGTGGTGTVISLEVLPRTATGTGAGTSSVLSKLIAYRTATGSGVSGSSSSSLEVLPRTATGAGSATTGDSAVINIVDIYENTDFKVEIEFPSSRFLDNAFTLDDATLGVLDGIGKLGAKNYYDVTEYVTEINVSRGRSRELDTFNAGTATVSFKNDTRIFDPTNSAGRFFGGILPRLRIRISANGFYLFHGYIEDWNIDYSAPTMSLANVSCTDAFSLLSTHLIEELSATYGERSDERIVSVLNQPEFVSSIPPYSLEVGTAVLTDDLIADQTNLLDYLQQVTQSEQGYLFMNTNGTLRFISRGASSTFAAATEANTVVLTDQTPSQRYEVKYSQIGVQYGTELLYNRVVVSNVDSAVTQTVNDTASQIDFQIRTLELSNLLLDTDANALKLGEYMLSQYSRPTYRYDTASVVITGLSNHSKYRLFSLELASLVKTVKNFSTGSPTNISKYGIIEGIQHTITPTDHIVSFSFSNKDTGFRLDSLLFGLLDSNTIS
jgi:hypothetical protein